MSSVVFLGCLLAKRSWVITGMVFGAAVASPITTFTRGGAGAIYASDLVSLTLLLCLFVPGSRRLFSSVAPKWYRRFLVLMLLALISVVVVAPLMTGDLATTEYGQRVRIQDVGVPLPLLIAGFRVGRIFLFVAYFVFAARLIMDHAMVRWATKMVAGAVLVLACGQIISFLGMAELSLYVPGWRHAHGHLFGHPKAAIGRIYIVGVFVALLLMYRSYASPAYLALLGGTVAAMFFSGSRAAVVGVAAGVCILGLSTRLGGKVVVTALICVGAFGGVFLAALAPERAESFATALYRPGESSRWEVWGWVMTHLFTHPYLLVSGVGFSNFQYALATAETFVAEHAHNDLLTCVTELGLIGLGLFVAFLMHLGLAIFRRIRRTTGRLRWEALCVAAAFGGLAVSGLFEHTFYFSSSGMPVQRLFAVFFGVHTAWWVQQAYQRSVELEFARTVASTAPADSSATAPVLTAGSAEGTTE